MKAPRIFIFNGQRLADPDGTKTPEQVREFYASEHPELTTAKVQFKRVEGKDQYEFVRSVGTKG